MISPGKVWRAGAWHDANIAVAAAAIGTGAIVFLDLGIGAMTLAGYLVGLGSLAGMISAPIAVTRSGKRRGVPGVRWLKFWKSAIGEGVFKLAGFRLKRVVSENAAHRPTEMAIGMAADRVFEALPKDERQSFAELPSIRTGSRETPRRCERGSKSWTD